MQDVLWRVRDVNRMDDDVRSSLLSFEVDGLVLGKVRPNTAKLLCSTYDSDPIFCMQEQEIPVSSSDNNNKKPVLTLNEKVAGSTFDSRTAAVARVMEKLREDGIITGWRNEDYPVATGFYEEPVFSMERAAVHFLGVLEYGVHINGLVRDRNGNGFPKMWIARRSKTKSKYPGMLDHIVAGGQPVGLSLMENCIKECWEEASIPEDLTRKGIRPAGAISYELYSPRSETISRAVLFNYDLYLPSDFVPKPVDGEVEEFFLWNTDDILAAMAKDYPDPIKPNCYSVIIDYLLREGILSPEVPGYLDVLRELRSGDCR